MSRKPEEFTILIDQREKRPYSFAGYPVDIQTCHLKTGDYSLRTETEDFSASGLCIERKSASDLYQSLTHHRERFEREFQRMNQFKYAFLVIESSLSGLLTPPEGSQANPKSIIQSVISWGIRYDIPVYFADTRELSECLIYSLCEKFLYNRKKQDAEIVKEINRMKSEELRVT